MNSEKLLRYSMQLSMLKQLRSLKLISEAEYQLVEKKLKKDYGGDQDWKKEIIQSYYRIILLCRQRPEMWKQLTGF